MRAFSLCSVADINECLNRSLCDDRCENLYGSYRCHCTLPGTTLSSDGHSCEGQCQGRTAVTCIQLNTQLSPIEDQCRCQDLNASAVGIHAMSR